MNTNKDESLLFASETAIFRIVSIAKITSWVLLVIYLYSFIENVRQNVMPMFQQQSFPTDVAQWISFLMNMLYPIALGVFYFLVMQGVAQGLNLGLDVFYELHPDTDDDVSFVEEEK
jgi:hypothetical protein